MKKAPAPLSSDPSLPFKYIGGDASLDLVNTVDWTARGPENERLTDYARLTRWAEGAGIVSAREGERLRREAAARPREARAAYNGATWLRWVLQRLYAAVAAGQRPGSSLDDFNDLHADALRHLRVGPAPPPQRQRGTRKIAEWDWLGKESLESLLWPVVWAAANLLISDEAERIRVCAGPDCGWIYVDRSRNRLRRWCQMETCGTQAKTRRRYARSHG
ncbi:MAG TPA: CGNR zinc finger domain-containing protein [Thermoanaerobaculia bacterium]|jgi:predicted RNA-binding Zn ribbon-like protein|nr:CGNR zinc finger domain-containing protein [Thermoanaerobaculia bacterium]